MLDKINEKNYPVLVIAIGVIILVFVLNHGLVNQMTELQDSLTIDLENEDQPEILVQPEAPSSAQQVDPRGDLLAPVSVEITPVQLLKIPLNSVNDDAPEVYELPTRNVILLQ